VYRFGPDIVPAVDFSALGFFCLTKTSDEVSVVCQSGLLDSAGRTEDGWKILKIAGPLDFCLVGVLAETSALLAKAGVSIFAISTFDTDYLLVKRENLGSAREALERGGHSVSCCPDEASSLDCREPEARRRGFEEGRDEKTFGDDGNSPYRDRQLQPGFRPSILGLSPGERLERIRDSRVELSPASCRTGRVSCGLGPRVAFIAMTDMLLKFSSLIPTPALLAHRRSARFWKIGEAIYGSDPMAAALLDMTRRWAASTKFDSGKR